jgi:hypothetical protein
MTINEPGRLIRIGVLAGAAGGLAEIVWVSLYAGLTGGDAAILARGVTTAAGISAVLPVAPVAAGIAVHMVLAVLLGIGLAVLLQVLGARRVATLYTVSLLALAAVWATNFFIVLPILSPAFVLAVPYAVSLTSKLLFGFAAAETLRRSHAPAAAFVRAS